MLKEYDKRSTTNTNSQVVSLFTLVSLRGGCFLSNHKRRIKSLGDTQWVEGMRGMGRGAESTKQNLGRKAFRSALASGSETTVVQVNNDLRGIKLTVSLFSQWQRSIHLTLSLALLFQFDRLSFLRSGK